MYAMFLGSLKEKIPILFLTLICPWCDNRLKGRGRRKWLLGPCVDKRVMVYLHVSLARPLSCSQCQLDLFISSYLTFVFVVFLGNAKGVQVRR